MLCAELKITSKYVILHQFADKLRSVLSTRTLEEKLRLVIFTESAESLLSLPEICRRGVELSHNSPFLLDAIVFGSDDFCADIGEGLCERN